MPNRLIPPGASRAISLKYKSFVNIYNNNNNLLMLTAVYMGRTLRGRRHYSETLISHSKEIEYQFVNDSAIILPSPE